MSYKSMIVQLDTSERAHPRLEYALRLAKQFDAHLSGVFAAFTPDPRSFYVMAGSPEYYEEHRKFRQERHGALERIFHAELLRAGVSGQWIDRNEYASEAMPRYARCADLVIAGRHGVKAEVSELDGVDDVPLGDMLLSRASQLGADLVVMGAYGHSRWQELVMGGATRNMLQSMTVPVLMSH
jgi:nucleotide-binding universal stress UspA family protein